MPKISVIVLVYKVEKYLRRCVDSILAQTFTDFELILVDDGSPDDCPIICDEYAQKDARVHMIHKINGGLSDARNAGIDWAFAYSDSEWITFIDSDDWVHPQYLEQLYNAVTEHKVAVGLCYYERTEGHIDKHCTDSICSAIWATEEFYKKNQVTAIIACAKLYKKECFQTIRYPVGRIHEDEFTTYKILFMYEQIAVIDHPLYYYYQNENSITANARVFSMHEYDRLLAQEEQMKFFKKIQREQLAPYNAVHFKVKIAEYSLKARKAGIYRRVPEQYKMSWIRAMRVLKKELSRDQYESVLAPIYPRYIKLQAYWHRLGKI